MRSRRRAAALTAAAAAVLLTSCATQVDGTGTGAGPHGGPSAAPSAPSASPGPITSAPSASASSAPSSSAGDRHPVPSEPLRQVSVAGSGVTYRVQVWAENQTSDCAAHAYGRPMLAFLHKHPCYGLRSVLATTTVDGRAVGFAQRTIGFRGAGNAGYRTAGQFHALVSRSGTGNLDDLLREGYRLPAGPAHVPFPNAFNAQAQDNSVTVVEAWYLHGPTPDNDPALEHMERDIFLQV